MCLFLFLPLNLWTVFPEVRLLGQKINECIISLYIARLSSMRVLLFYIPSRLPWRRQWHPTPVLLPWKSHGWKSLVGCSPWGRTWLSDFTFTFQFHALEKEMATHPSVLAWRISGMGEPGGLPSMGSHRVRHNWSDLAAAAAAFPLL